MYLAPGGAREGHDRIAERLAYFQHRNRIPIQISSALLGSAEELR